jgi:hypothetical protein
VSSPCVGRGNRHRYTLVRGRSRCAGTNRGSTDTSTSSEESPTIGQVSAGGSHLVGPLLLALQIPRPFESIIDIYCPWHPETSASPNSRITVLDELRKRYMDLAWRLMISMLPDSHELRIPTHEPDYTDWKLDQKGID